MTTENGPNRFPVRDRILEVIERGDDLEAGELADRVTATLADVDVTVTLALVSRVHALEDALRRLADAAYPLVDHARAHEPSDVVIPGKRIGVDDGVHEVTGRQLDEVAQAVDQAEEAFWPTDTVDLAPELLHAPEGTQ